MPVGRNNIAQHYPRRAKRQMVYWREVEGMPPVAVRRKAAAAWPDLPVIHDRTWASWTQSREYSDLRASLCEGREADRAVDADWAAIEAGDMDDLLKALIFQAVKDARAAGKELDFLDLRRLVSSATNLGKLHLDRELAARDQRIAAIETEHAQDLAAAAAELAQAKAEIARLQAELTDLKAGGNVELGDLADRMDQLLGGK